MRLEDDECISKVACPYCKQRKGTPCKRVRIGTRWNLRQDRWVTIPPGFVRSHKPRREYVSLILGQLEGSGAMEMCGWCNIPMSVVAKRRGQPVRWRCQSCRTLRLLEDKGAGL